MADFRDPSSRLPRAQTAQSAATSCGIYENYVKSGRCGRYGSCGIFEYIRSRWDISSGPLRFQTRRSRMRAWNYGDIMVCLLKYSVELAQVLSDKQPDRPNQIQSADPRRVPLTTWNKACQTRGSRLLII